MLYWKGTLRSSELSYILTKQFIVGMVGSGRRGGLVVSALDSGLRGPGSSPGRVIVLCSWARHFTLIVPLSPPRSTNCQGNLKKYWEVTCDGVASHPGGVAILLVSSCYRNRDKLRQSWARKT